MKRYFDDIIEDNPKTPAGIIPTIIYVSLNVWFLANTVTFMSVFANTTFRNNVHGIPKPATQNRVDYNLNVARIVNLNSDLATCHRQVSYGQ